MGNSSESQYSRSKILFSKVWTYDGFGRSTGRQLLSLLLCELALSDRWPPVGSKLVLSMAGASATELDRGLSDGLPDRSETELLGELCEVWGISSVRQARVSVVTVV